MLFRLYLKFLREPKPKITKNFTYLTLTAINDEFYNLIVL